jgi:RNase H-fold protein (predicted Holliday junction resolvase)
MPKTYVLKKEALSKESVNRLIKSLVDNAKEDRAEAKHFLDLIKQRMDGPFEFTDEFTRMATAASQLLSKLQDSSTNLSKAVEAILKYMSLNKTTKGDKAPIMDSLFSELSSLQED